MRNDAMRISKWILAGTLTWSTFGTAQAIEFTDFRQVVVVSRQGEATEAVQAAALESLSRSLQRGLMRGLSSELMGAGAGFKKRKETQLGSLVTALTAIDRFMNEETMSALTRNAMIQSPGAVLGRNPQGGLPAALKAMGDEWGSITLEWMILPKDAKVPPTVAGSMGEKLKTTALTAAAQVAELAKLSGTPQDFDNALKVYDVADGIELVDASKVDTSGLYAESFNAYKQLLRNENLKFVPAHIRFYITFARGKVKFEAQARMKPGPLSKSLFAAEEVVSPKIMEYLPHLSYNDTYPAAMMVGLEREYGTSKNEAILHVMFGRFVTRDIRSINPCRMDCKKDLAPPNIGSNYPTISGQFQFDKVKTKKVLQKAANMLSDTVSGSSGFYILLQDIAIRINEKGMTVDPKLTAVTLGVGEGKKLRQFNAANNAKVMGVDLGVMGLDVYSQVLGPEVSKNLNTEVNNSLKAANADAADQLKLALTPITDVLR